jgi:hypothetical protein
MAKFRIGLGIFLILIGFLLLWVGVDAQNSGMDLTQPDGTRGAALWDVFGVWGVFVLMEIYGVVEIRAGWRLLRHDE